MVKMSRRVREVHSKIGERCSDGRPFLEVNKHQDWNGQPCDQCGTTSKTDNRYIADPAEDDNPLYLCGKCVDTLENEFEYNTEF